VQALLPYLTPLKESLQQLKTCKGSSSKAGRKGSSKPTHVELVLDVKQLVFSIEQHWMEMWMAVHGPVLQVGCCQQLMLLMLLQHMMPGTALVAVLAWQSGQEACPKGL
jgi:hypothetical protein